VIGAYRIEYYVEGLNNPNAIAVDLNQGSFVCLNLANETAVISLVNATAGKGLENVVNWKVRAKMGDNLMGGGLIFDVSIADEESLTTAG